MKTLNLQAAAEFLNISTDSLKDLAGGGVVPAAKIGKAWVFSDESLDDYLREEIRKQTAERRGQPSIKVPTSYTRTVRRQPRTPPALNRSSL